jgi:hypothetical protein
MRRLLVAGFMAAAAPLSAQAVGGVSGFVREAGETKTPLLGARLVVDNGRYVAVTDAQGFYRLREIPAGGTRSAPLPSAIGRSVVTACLFEAARSPGSIFR